MGTGPAEWQTETLQTTPSLALSTLKGYDVVVKYVLLAIFVLFAAQPLQAAPCDMHDTQGTTHNQHGDMQENSDMDMDCCDHDPSAPADNCDSQFHCGASTAAVTINSGTVNVNFSPGSRHFLPGSGEPISAFSSPPFRPPIA
jgi:hypothetical protein